MDLIKRKQQNILLHRVTIGERTVSIPVAQLGNGEGESVVITAGIDGDEYSGIEAAYALIEYFTKNRFIGKLVIIPIINIPGFEKGVSWNPLDGKYPKHIFPGKEKGSSSEKLIYWLDQNFLQDATVWIDIHSGATTEILEPFIQIGNTSKKEIAVRIQLLLAKIKANTILFSSSLHPLLAKRNCIYVRLEAGQLGKRNKMDVKQHINWVKQVLSTKENKKIGKKQIWKEIREFTCEKEGIWVTSFIGKQVKRGVLLGEVRSLDGKMLQKIIAKENGIFLWRREAMSCQKGDSLYAYAHNKDIR
jgi:predicted deacylase